MKKVLFVGEHPRSGTGNGNMLAAILTALDTKRYQFACFIIHDVDPLPIVFNPIPFTMIQAATPADYWGSQKLVNLAERLDFDILCMVGLDIWRYRDIWDRIVQLRNTRKFKWIWLFPYDLNQVRLDWIKWMNDLDAPCAYSHYGKEVLKDHVPKIEYFRPPLFNAELFRPFSEKERQAARKEVFPNIRDKQIIGFVGRNQVRKSPERLIKAFLLAKKVNPNILLYLHTDMQDIFNLTQVAKDFGAVTGDMVTKQQGIKYSTEQMVKIYNAMDVYVNCSMQEGLSWTVIEAMVCGRPIVVSATTGHFELATGIGEMVNCKDLSFLSTVTEGGGSQIDAYACRPSDIASAILEVISDPKKQEVMAQKSFGKAKDWLSGVSDINDLFDREVREARVISLPSKLNKVLFAQFSSAGDVLMTTQCFKGIRERHKDMPLVYMTRSIYQDIVEGNPYIDEIIDWNDATLRKYKVVYNPHGEKILRGRFNNGNVPLYQMYPYFCKVDADEMFIQERKPSFINTEDDYDEDERFKIDYNEWPKEYIVVHTTGGSVAHRTYKHMDTVISLLGMPTVQLGGPLDMACLEATIDLRGKLSFRESAWVMKNAKAAIVVDSFLSHLAGCVGTPAVITYGPAPARVVGPRSNGSRIINLEPNHLDVCPTVGACYGEESCKSPCINTINPYKIRDAVLNLIGDKNA